VSIYTLGTSNREWDAFLLLLRHYGIGAVADVRRWPGSRFEHFRREHLEPGLRAVRLAYHYLGDSLGGFRSGGYEAYVRTAEFAAGLAALEDIARETSAAVVCAERLPWKCHRRFIGTELAQRGWEVVHVIDIDRTWEPGPASAEPSLL
jgi:uncharacterized protein (DUF488 family)